MSDTKKSIDSCTWSPKQIRPNIDDATDPKGVENMHLFLHSHLVWFPWKADLVELFLESTKSGLNCPDCLLKEVQEGWGDVFLGSIVFHLSLGHPAFE